MALHLPRLPLDLATFRILREEGYLYVDKTQHAYNLITGGRRFFLSRPRRFGKSLFVSTLREILLGNRDLFEELWVGSSDYPWRPHGVITLNLSAIGAKDEASLENGLYVLFTEAIELYQLNIVLERKGLESDLRSLVRALHAKYKRVALLVDEYDGPILRDLQNQEHTKKMRDILNRLFTAVKGLDEYINFVFITGVSAFSKAGIFSGMNDLQVITLREACADICGYTDTEVDAYFTQHIEAWARKDGLSYGEQRERIRKWYNGYRFSSAKTTVYSPFSVMHAFYDQKLDNFWFSSATPTFLIEELKRQQRENPEAFEDILQDQPIDITQGSLGSFDIGLTPLPALMFQTGYLTISDYDKATNSYQLYYPNHEVEQSLKVYLLSIVTKLNSNLTETLTITLSRALAKQDLAAVGQIIRQLFAHIPYQIDGKDEKYYHAILQMAFTVAGLIAHAEVATSHGRIDLVIDMDKIIYVIEVKFNEPAARALAQIEERRYYERYVLRQYIMLLGIAFIRGPNTFEVECEGKLLRAS